MTGHQVRDLLDDVFDDEPARPDAAVAVFGLAEKLRKRRRRRVLIAATCFVVLVALAGNAVSELLAPTAGRGRTAGLTGTPATPGADPTAVTGAPTAPGAPNASAASTASPATSASAEPVLALAVKALGPGGHSFEPDGKGDGWRRYTVASEGKVTGRLAVVLYSTTGGLCLPPTPKPSEDCVRMPVRNGVRYYTYDDADRRFTQVVAVRQADSRVFALHATGAGADGSDAAAALTVTELKRLALDPRLPDAFGADESCDRPDPSCPTLGLPVPPDRE